MTTAATAAPPGGINFYDDYLPALDAATYTVTVSQRIVLGTDGAAPTPDHVRTIEVVGPRFTLPAADVHAVYPPDQSSGTCSHQLPQVVLGRRMLPWERQITAPAPRKDGQRAPRPPWMALLVLEPAEIAAQSPDAGTTVAAMMTPAANVVLPDLTPDADETTLVCHSLELAGELFLQLAPTMAELPYLAHCRQADTSGKADLNLVEDGWFSAVVANRFPRAARADEAAGVRHVAHLVSLEGWDQVLDGSTRLPARTDDATRLQNVRLVSLTSWTFRCLADLNETFTGLAGALVTATTQDGPRALLRLPIACGDAGLQARFDAGFAPVSYCTRHGEQTLAWYRGPLAPVLPNPAQEPDLGAAGPPVVYVAADGMFDLSLAAAWQLGRSLAVADAAFVEAVNALRLNGRRLMDRLVAFKEAGVALPGELDALAAANPAVNRMVQALTGGLASHVATIGMAGGGGVAPPPGPPPIPPLDALRALFQDPAAIALMQAQATHDSDLIAGWLVRLRLLRNAPFDYLVPRAEMLPAERLRLFSIDPGWVQTLVAGALSLAAGSTLDALYLGVARPVLDAGVQAGLAAIAGGADCSAQPMAGMLLRSDIVAGHPGLAVRPLRNGQPLPVLRIEQLSASVLICLFLGLPDRIEVCEPREGLRFGVDDQGQCVMRTLTGDDAGTPLPSNDPQLPRTMLLTTPDFPGGGNLRPGDLRVLDISGALAANLAAAAGVAVIGPAQFALLMVNAPERAVFLPTASPISQASQGPRP